VRTLADEKHVQIVEPLTNAVICADEGRLVQVLVNLLGNALKFSPEGSIVTVALEDSEASLELSIVDHGPGIPAEYLEKVFDRFRQVDSTDATVRGGSGLGLAIAKAIVQAHGGEIGVKSTLGQGSTFWFRIPKRAG
jgi:signal transduction histidine kinase